MMFDVKIYFYSVLLSRASEISGVYICVVIALWISGKLFIAFEWLRKIYFSYISLFCCAVCAVKFQDNH